MEHTKSLASEFGKPGGVGEKLQKLLEKRAEEKDNWVSNRCHFVVCKNLVLMPFPQLYEWWGQVAYLGYRLPVVVHSSPGIGYPLMPAKNVHEFTRYAYTCMIQRITNGFI